MNQIIFEKLCLSRKNKLFGIIYNINFESHKKKKIKPQKNPTIFNFYFFKKNYFRLNSSRFSLSVILKAEQIPKYNPKKPKYHFFIINSSVFSFP